MFNNLKIAIVYDWIDKWGGVERVLLTLHDMFPDAVFYTSYIDKNKAVWAENMPVYPSFIQRIPQFIRKSRILSVPLYPFAFESFNFNAYDVVISVTSSFAKAIITKPQTKHICYLLTPTRFLWSHEDEYMQNKIKKTLLNPYMKYFKSWDYIAAQRPDKIISLSHTVKERCKKYYKRDSEVIYPPFDIQYWNKIKLEIQNPKFGTNSKYKIPNTKYFLVVSRLEPYKKVDVAIKTFNQLPKETLIVVGTGSLEQSLRKTAKKNIQFIPYVLDEKLAQLYSGAQALIMPQEEDFGYVSLEAQYFGCPVLAFNKGGAIETVINHKTGLFYPYQTRISLQRVLEQFHIISYNLKASTKKNGLKNVERFSKEEFIEKFRSQMANLKNQNYNSKL